MNLSPAPRTLAMRLFLLLLGGVLAAVFITSGLAIRERGRAVKTVREEGAAERMADFLHLLAALEPGQRLATVSRLPSGHWRMADYGDAPPPPPVPTFSAALAAAASPEIRVESAWRRRDPACEDGPEPCPPIRTLGAVVRFADGQRVLIESTREPPPHHHPPPPFERFARDLAILSALLALLAWLAVGLVLQPLRRLAAAAEAFGRDPDHPAMDESGPAEVRQAAATFNRMRDRLRAHIEERTRILAAITHDLKTPLTRLRLRLEQLDDAPLRSRLEGDLAAMQGLIDEGLDLARSLDRGQPPQILDLAALLQSLCDDAEDAGGEVHYDGPASAPIRARPEALRRAFQNLLDNALKHGGSARVSLAQEGRGWRAAIADAGPGIPEAQLADVMRPFVRLENSRSRETGGTGLGLPIAANLIAAQGGHLTLRNRPEGGLEASVQLPAGTE